MKDRRSFFLPIACGAGVLLAGACGLGPATGWAAEIGTFPSLGRPVPVQSSGATIQAMTLYECLALARERQPRLAVQRAGLAAAVDGQRALAAICLPEFFFRELCFRRRQSDLGVAASAAALDQVEHETVYAVTRTYFTVIYARSQEQIAQRVVDRLAAVHESAGSSLKGGARNVTQNDVDRTAVYLGLARAKKAEAAEGVYRGLGALKQAIGVGQDCPLDVPRGRLPEPSLQLHQEEIVALALARRPELLRAGTFAEITALEIEAQATCSKLRMETFAAGGDIHSRHVPQGSRNTEYRPGSDPPNMPTMLAGSRAERMKHAESLHERAVAQLADARNLVALDAEDTFRRWQEASQKVGHTRQAAAAGERLAQSLNSDFVAGVGVKIEDVINAHVLASQAQAQLVEALYHQVLTLAELELVTAGGFCAAPAWQAVPATTSPSSDKPAKPANEKLFDTR